MIYEDIPQFKEGEVVFLKSDLNRKSPMTVVSDHTSEYKEEVKFTNIDDYFLLSPKERFTGNIIKTRIVECEWFNSQRKVENRRFYPPQLLSLNDAKKTDL